MLFSSDVFWCWSTFKFDSDHFLFWIEKKCYAWLHCAKYCYELILIITVKSLESDKYLNFRLGIQTEVKLWPLIKNMALHFFFHIFSPKYSIKLTKHGHIFRKQKYILKKIQSYQNQVVHINEIFLKIYHFQTDSIATQ